MGNITTLIIPLFHYIISDPKRIEKTPISFFDKDTGIYHIYELIKHNKNTWNSANALQVKTLIREKGLQISDDIIDNIFNANEFVDRSWLDEKYKIQLELSSTKNTLTSLITDFKMLGDNISLDAIKKFQNKLRKDLERLTKSDDAKDKWSKFLEPIPPDDATPILLGHRYFDQWQAIKKKRTTCFIGKTNSGKTVSLIGICADAIKMGHKVAYISFEVEKEYIHAKILAQLLGMHEKEVRSIDPRKVLQLWDEKYKNIKTPEIFSDSYSTYNHNKLCGELLAKEEEMGEKFDLIIIDYLTLLHSEKEFYLKGEELSQAFRDYSKSYNWAIVTAAQANRSGLAKIRLEMNDIAESAAMLHSFDYLITLIHSERLREENCIAWEMIKARYINEEYRVGSMTSFNQNWKLGGKYSELPMSRTEEIVEQIKDDESGKKTTPKTKRTKVKDPTVAVDVSTFISTRYDKVEDLFI